VSNISSTTTSLIEAPPTYSSDICRIKQIHDSSDQNDYIQNLFEEMDDARVNHEDYYHIMVDVDAHANSLVESLKPHAYLSEVNIIDTSYFFV
jgi:hypothetical protein